MKSDQDGQTFKSMVGQSVLPSSLHVYDDPTMKEYGGTYLLGVRGLVVICHGSSSRRAVANALRFAARAAEQGLVTQLPVDVEAALAASTRASDTVGGEVS